MSYESERLLNEYLLMHYGSDADLMPWEGGPGNSTGFPARTVGHFPEKTDSRRALDLGCAVGRSSFELSRRCGEVLGIDYSHSFIAAAERLRTDGSLGYTILETGNRTRPATAAIPAGCRPDRVRFQQGDAMALPAGLGEFDLVHAANLVCRLPRPQDLLRRLPGLVRPGGHLVLATPCTWLDEFTPPENQPGGDTFGWLQRQLDGAFDLVSRHDEPFLIRETARKFQWSVSLVTLWVRSHPAA